MKNDLLITENHPSNTKLQIFKSNLLSEIFTFDSKPIIILGTIDNPLFVGKQICDILEYKNHRDILKKHIEDKWKIKYKFLTDTHPSVLESIKTIPFDFRTDTDLITESGLYSLIFNSKLEKAKMFRDMVFEKVLPSIRKTGQFKLEQLELQLQEANNTLQIKEKEIKKITESREKLLKRRKRTPYEIGNVFYIVSNISFFIHYNCSYLKPGEATQSNRESDATFITRLSTYNTGSPHNYDVNALFYIEENVLIEKIVKAKFRNYINPNSKEWIKDIDLSTICSFVRHICELLQFEYKEVVFDDTYKKYEEEKKAEDVEGKVEVEDEEEEEVEVEEEVVEEVEVEEEVEDEVEEEDNEIEEEIEYAVENEVDDNISYVHDMEKVKQYFSMGDDLDKYTCKQLSKILKEFNLKQCGLKHVLLERLTIFLKDEIKNPSIKPREDNKIKEEILVDERTYTQTINGVIYSQRKKDGYINLTQITVSCKKPMSNWSRVINLKIARDKYLLENPHIKPFEIVHKKDTWVDVYFAKDYCKWAKLDKDLMAFLNRGDVWDEYIPKTSKVCSTCKKDKIFIEFTSDIKISDGYSRDCRVCSKQKYIKDNDKRKKLALDCYHKIKT